MPHLWLEYQTAQDSELPAGASWVVMPITGDSQPLPGMESQPEELTRKGKRDAAGATLMRTGGPDDERWAILGPASVQVNGVPLLGGIRILNDRDEIRACDGAPFYFSTERLAKVEPFPGTGRRTFCARCKTEIAVGTPAVRCPGCGMWCHQSEADGLLCWQYPGTSTCPLCDFPNALDGTYRWSPENL